MSNPWIGGLGATEAAERASAYAQRFDRLATDGGDVHGEADLVAALYPEGALLTDRGLVLDAGCGTGRVAARLAERGYRTIGVDLDTGMLDQARRRHPELTWIESDLADLRLEPPNGGSIESATANDGLTGSTSNDRLTGSTSNDRLTGSTSDDGLIGRPPSAAGPGWSAPSGSP